ncbi:MAG: riboflavin biosynthesis protein RibF [Chloroflexi bacterium]|nr:riboflavin biosynthesis protein RibF [Chloroflexota bacterium]
MTERLISALEPTPPRESVVTIGTFDGLHRGHQHLISQVLARAAAVDREAIVITFVPHPRSVLHPELPVAYLTSTEERLSRLRTAGFNRVIALEFTPELAAMRAEDFVDHISAGLCMRELWIGHDFRLGAGQQGDAAHLAQYGERLGYQLHVIEALMDGGAPINSTRIRELVLAGQVADAARLLGRPYTIGGTVIQGRHVGRTLGVRTANIACDPERVIPTNGVYAAWALVKGERRMAALNIGIRPSFGESERLLEAHLLGYDGDVYNAQLELQLIQYLRPELVFESREALIEQIHQDIALTRQMLGTDDKGIEPWLT